jgi:hypothetical protein
LAKLKEIFRQNISQPVERVIEQINAILRGWVNLIHISGNRAIPGLWLSFAAACGSTATVFACFLGGWC